jgi:uncharacterized membrane protein
MQNPPPSQQGYGYGSPFGTPPPGGPLTTLPGGEPGAKSALGVDGNVAGALAYIGIIGLILLIMEKDNRFVRFHALQSLITGVGAFVLYMVLLVVGVLFSFIFAAMRLGSLVAIIWVLLWLVIVVLGIATFAGIVIAAVKAYQGQILKLPIVGNIAEKFATK